ncbi:MAG: 50S ribosomal protein L11 [Spiroplasma sp.]
MAQFKDPNINRIAIIQLPAGMAKPGASLASFGIDMPRFCREFNDKTKDQKDETNPVPIPVKLIAFKNKDFKFELKTPPTTFLIKKVLKLGKGSSNAKLTKVATLTKEQITEIAKIKMPDLNAYDLETAIKIVAGTAKNMGINISE